MSARVLVRGVKKVPRELTVHKILRFQGLTTDGREGMILIQKILREFRRSNGTKRAYSC